METPIQITFHGLESSEAVKAKIRSRARDLERMAPRLTSCHVTVEQTSNRHHKGNLYAARIDLRLPNGELAASRNGTVDHSHEDVYVAIRDAFDALERQLEDYLRKQRGQVKTHEQPTQGRVSRLFKEQGYGFVTLPDGMDVYFHENSVIGSSLQELEIGDEVRLVLVETESEKGPQASTVTPTGKHREPAWVIV